MDATKPIVKVGSGKLPERYANNISVEMSLWDFVLTFGIITNASETHIDIRDDERIILSPSCAKELSRLLARQLSKYEQGFGRIPEWVGGDKPADNVDDDGEE